MLELNAIFYSLYLVWDAKMTYLNSSKGQIESAKMNSLNLIENLGEVDYIMSDKTGTLTKNELTFAAVCCEEGSSYIKGQISYNETEGKNPTP